MILISDDGKIIDSIDGVPPLVGQEIMIENDNYIVESVRHKIPKIQNINQIVTLVNIKKIVEKK